jgi:hypothetical protein
MIHRGAIGQAYEARTWYTNQRGSIGNGKETDPRTGWTGTCGKVLRRGRRIAIISYTTTGISSDSGAPVKSVIMQSTKSTSHYGH